MNNIIFGLFFLMTFPSVIMSQNTINHIYGLDYESFDIAGDIKKDCFIDKYVKDDTLYIKVFSQFQCHKMTGWIHFENDTLKLNAYNDYTESETTTYDSVTGQYMTTITMNQPICCGRCGFILEFKTSPEFYDKPIRFQNIDLITCTDETKFEIIGSDTINRIDKYGLKQGAWMEFHENGIISKLDTFYNGKIIIGYEFNLNGKTIAKTSGGYQVVTYRSLTDTIIFKDFPRAPKIKRIE